MSKFAINIYDTNSVHLLDIGPLAEQFKVSTVLPGGCARASWRVPHPAFVIPDWAGFNYRVDILDERGIFWAGRMEDLVAIRDSRGEWWEIGCSGFGVNGDDQAYTAQDVNGLQTSAIVTNAISSLMPQIGATSIDATGVTLSAASAITLKMMKGGQVIGWASQLGDSSNNAQIWYVYPDADRTIRLTYTDRPTSTGVHLSLLQLANARFGLSGRQVANRIIVQYNGAASTVTVNDTVLQAAGAWNLITAKMGIYDEITQSADATQLANALLTKLKILRMSATSLRVNPDAVITDGDDAPIALWRVRAGQLCRLTDVTAAFMSNDQISFNNSFLIVGTEYSEDDQSLVITPESYDTYLQIETARARQLMEGRHTIHT